MISRKGFIISVLSATAAVTMLAKGGGISVKNRNSMKKVKPQTGLVVWYSQTGNTSRIGRSIALQWKRSGIETVSGDYRDIDRNTLDQYDIIAVGTPVYYYEVPENFRNWLKGIPRLEGIPVAPFVTFGGEGGNQHNTLCELAELLTERGGAIAGGEGFSCAPAWALTWSMGNVERILRYSELPDEKSFTAAGNFASSVLKRAESGEAAEVSGNFSLRNIIRGNPSIGFTKLLVTGHSVNREKCTGCGRCEKSCPVNAINPGSGTVETGKCIACLGCINNCPAGAVEMKFMGNEVYGRREFMKRNRISVKEPS